MKVLSVKFNKNLNEQILNEFQAKIIDVMPYTPVFVERGALAASDVDITKYLGYVFDVIILLTMFLCFFALSANMSANLFE